MECRMVPEQLIFPPESPQCFLHLDLVEYVHLPLPLLLDWPCLLSVILVLVSRLDAVLYVFS